MINEHYQKTKEYQDDIILTDDIKRAVMSKVDVKSILETWGVRPKYRNGQWNGYCPTHYIHDGHSQHAPKWSMNAETGDSTCFTSNKHENFIIIAKKIYRFKTIKETIDKLLGNTVLEIPSFGYVVEDAVAKWQEEERLLEEKRLKTLSQRMNWLCKKLQMRKTDKHHGLTDECIAYFEKDGITKETLDIFGITAETWLHPSIYSGRAIIPFIDYDGKDYSLCGYIAVCYEEKQYQIKRYAQIDSDNTGKDLSERIAYYNDAWKKVLYCPGFLSRNHLFGRYEALADMTVWNELMIVEGERDAIKMLQEGIPCVSIHGTVLKQEQISMIRKMNPKVTYLGFDMDKAGREACIKAYEQLSGEIGKIVILNFPDGKDPKKFNGKEIREIIYESEKQQ